MCIINLTYHRPIAEADTMLPAVQTLLIYHCINWVAGRIFSYNQSLRDIANVSGPLIDTAVSANPGFRAIFCVTTLGVLLNAVNW